MRANYKIRILLTIGVVVLSFSLKSQNKSSYVNVQTIVNEQTIGFIPKWEVINPEHQEYVIHNSIISQIENNSILIEPTGIGIPTYSLYAISGIKTDHALKMNSDSPKIVWGRETPREFSIYKNIGEEEIKHLSIDEDGKLTIGSDLNQNEKINLSALLLEVKGNAIIGQNLCFDNQAASLTIGSSMNPYSRFQVLACDENGNHLLAGFNEAGYLGLGTEEPEARLCVEGNDDNWIAKFKNLHSTGNGVLIQTGLSQYNTVFELQNASPEPTFFKAYGSGYIDLGNPEQHNCARLNVDGNVIISQNTNTNSNENAFNQNNQLTETSSLLEVKGNATIGQNLRFDSQTAGLTIGSSMNPYSRFQVLACDENGNHLLAGFNEAGYLGLGTEEPEARLCVEGNDANWIAKIKNSEWTGNGVLIQADITQTNTVFELQNSYAEPTFFKAWGSGYIDLGNPEQHNCARLNVDGNVIIKHNSNENSHALSVDGNVMITNNTNANSYALSVDGGIITTKLRVQNVNNWPDFVFSESYSLKKITDLESFIKKNKHLPDLPSAATIEKEGIDIVEMEKILLQKIEELSLYIIEQNKQLSKQQNDINELNKKIEKLNQNVVK